MKKTGVALRNRIIAAPSVESWARRIEGLEREVAEVMREEREERALRKAEQEATKVLALPRFAGGNAVRPSLGENYCH